MVNGGNVRVCVNTFNRLKKIRAGVVYDSITTVIDELLQNCQRTFMFGKIETPMIDIIMEEATIIIRDNGNGCEDPQSIFEFEASGWEISDAFGQGGSESVFQIADSIVIRSREWIASVDVVEMLETGDLGVLVMPVDEFFNGYEITITGEKIKDHLSLLKTYVKTICQYFDCVCHLNGQLIEHTELQEIKSPHQIKFDNQFYSAILGVSRSYRDSQIYYEKRKVCDVWLCGICGIIELKRDAVNLKAPDRKAIISDDKNDAFHSQLKKDCLTIYTSFIKVATPEQFVAYEYFIDYNLTPEQYADYLPDYDVTLQQVRDKELKSEVPSHGTIVSLGEATAVTEENAKNMKYVSGTSASYSEGGLQLIPTHIPAHKGSIKQRIGNVFNIVWCESSRKDELQEMINLAESYNLKVIYSKGKLYNKSFEFWKIPHIEKVMNKTKASYIIGREGGYVSAGNKYYRDYSKKEDRLLRVLKKIEEYYGLEDVFKIADVKEHLSLKDEDTTIMDTIVKKASAPIKDRKKIYLDRESLNLGRVNISTSQASVTKFDILIIMLNIQTIASGLAQIVYNTVDKTVEHYSKMEKISKEIALLLASI